MSTLRNSKREMRKLSFKGYNYILSIYIIIYHYAPDTHCRIANLRKVKIANLRKKSKDKKIAFREILLTLRRNVLIETLQKCKINGEEYEKRRRSTTTCRFSITYKLQDISKAFRKLKTL